MTTYNAPVEEMMFLFNNLKDNKKTQDRIVHTLKTGKPLVN